MGNSSHSSKNVQTNEIEKMLLATFKNSDINFTYKEVLTIKLRVEDAKKYFQTDFNYIIYFNSFIFKERLSVLYDNFSNVVESFSKVSSNDVFFMLIDFDEEADQNTYFEENIPQKIDYESLFTIIFEALEIKTIKFFLMTNMNKSTLLNYFEQMYENIYLYKSNRNYDVMYFLLPNLDILIRNGGFMVYIVSQPNSFDESLDMLSDYTVSYSKGYLEDLFLSSHFKDFLLQESSSGFPPNKLYIDKFVSSLIPSPEFIKCIFNFDLSIEDIGTFIEKYDREFKVIEIIIENSKVCSLLINLNLSNSKNKITNACTINIELFKIVLIKLMNIFDKSHFYKAYLAIKFVFLINKSYYQQENFEKINTVCNDTILTLLSDSFCLSKRGRIRKIVVEFYENYPINDEDYKELIGSNENAQLRKKIVCHTHKFKIYYLWFLNAKYIHKMENKIYNLLNSKIPQRAFPKIFGYMFNENYFLHKNSVYKGKFFYTELEKSFFI